MKDSKHHRSKDGHHHGEKGGHHGESGKGKFGRFFSKLSGRAEREDAQSERPAKDESSNGEQRGGGPQMMSGILSVKSKTFLTPHYIRVILEGSDLKNYAQATVGDNNKLIFPENGKIELPKGGRPQGMVRTYTLRALNLAESEMTIDFVAHGDEGPASAWALQAKPGDQLGVLMKQKGKELYKPADWYLLVGDHTALPVISVILESLPASAKGKVILEVYSEADILPLVHPAGVDIQWIFNDHPGKEAKLAIAFEQVEIPQSGRRFIFSAAEFSNVRQIQSLIRDMSFLDRDEWQSFSYWKYGVSESDSAGERRDMTHRG